MSMVGSAGRLAGLVIVGCAGVILLTRAAGAPGLHAPLDPTGKLKLVDLALVEILAAGAFGLVVGEAEFFGGHGMFRFFGGPTTIVEPRSGGGRRRF
jgi:hypothetical protein